ncbi:MAG: aminotransferase class IV [Candidatus Krumholzibacteriota bacterium]|nr:aminotransferase class IV [Candidatus Krumholzibacteriota bacterium]
MTGKKEIVFLSGNYINRDEARISPDDRGFIFADGVYEVVRSYRGKLFEPGHHIERLGRSLAALDIRGFDPALIENISEKLIESNDLSSCDSTVYIEVTRGTAPRSHTVPSPRVSPTVYAFASRLDRPVNKQKEGIAIIFVPDDRWGRCDIKSISLLPNILARQKAEDEGADEAVFVLGSDITEGSSSSFAAVFSGALATHPESPRILGGITRKIVIDLCERAGIPVDQRPIKKEELIYADEMMILSTTREVMPVTICDGKKVTSGKPGKITRRLQQLYTRYIEK